MDNLPTIDIDQYVSTAKDFARKIRNAFATEDSLRECWLEAFPSRPFDRTSDWNLILNRMLVASWTDHGPIVTCSMTRADVHVILHHLWWLLDFNLFTQVMLNLQWTSLVRYRVADADAALKEIEERYTEATISPLLPKAKMFKNATAPSEIAFNRDLSALKAIQAVGKVGPSVSFRVSPVGTTPALVDSANLSSFGFGADQYLQVPEGYGACYIALEDGPIPCEPVEDGFRVWGILGLYKSSSGGEVLGWVMRARKVAAQAFSAMKFPGFILPRMTSVLVVVDLRDEINLADAFGIDYAVTKGPR